MSNAIYVNKRNEKKQKWSIMIQLLYVSGRSLTTSQDEIGKY